MKMMKVLLLIFLFVANVHCLKAEYLKDQKLSLEKKNDFLSILSDLSLYIASEQNVKSWPNQELLQTKIESLRDVYSNLKNHPPVNTFGLVINQVEIVDQLNLSVDLIKKNNPWPGRAKFNATFNLCVSCHVEGKEKSINDRKFIESLKINLYERGELNFIAGSYLQAIKEYDQYIRSARSFLDPGNNGHPEEEFIFKALEKQLIYFIKIKKSFPEAREHFSKYIKEKILSHEVMREVEAWVKNLSTKSLWEQFNPVTTTENEMEKFLKKFIEDDEEGPFFSANNLGLVYDLNLSVILMDYYKQHPETKLGGKILYWLAILDKRISDDLFFSLADYYLLSCMEKYPKDPVAKDCYNTYMEELEIYYVGKEKKIPVNLQNKVKKLQKLIGL